MSPLDRSKREEMTMILELNHTPATDEDHLIWRRVASVAVHSAALKADRIDARIMSDGSKLSSRGHDLHAAYGRWVAERGRA